MAAKKTDKLNVPRLLRAPLEAAHQRLRVFERELEKLFAELRKKGEQRRKELASFAERLANHGFGMNELRDRLSSLPDHGVEYAAELRNWAENLRSELVRQFEALQTKAVVFLGMATRREVEQLAKNLARLSRRVEKAGKGADAARNAARPAMGT